MALWEIKHGPVLSQIRASLTCQQALWDNQRLFFAVEMNDQWKKRETLAPKVIDNFSTCHYFHVATLSVMASVQSTVGTIFPDPQKQAVTRSQCLLYFDAYECHCAKS